MSVLVIIVRQARASAQLGTRVPRELHRQAYNDALVQRYQHLPDIRRIQRHRRLPAPLYKARSHICSRLQLFSFGNHWQTCCACTPPGDSPSLS